MRLFVALLVLWASVAQAQTTDLPTSYELRIFAPGAIVAQFSTSFSATVAACNLVTPVYPVGPQTNPNWAYWDDPAFPPNSGKVCRVDVTTLGTSGGPIAVLPSGSYEGALVGLNAGGTGLLGNRDPFLRSRAPAAPTGLRIIR